MVAFFIIIFHSIPNTAWIQNIIKIKVMNIKGGDKNIENTKIIYKSD